MDSSSLPVDVDESEAVLERVLATVSGDTMGGREDSISRTL